MFAPFLDGVRADIDRQIDWAKVEVRQQTRYTAVIGFSRVWLRSVRSLSVSSPFISA